MELVCPAGNFRALREAVDAGADAVYLGLRDDTNARHFSGLNFSPTDLERAVGYARDRGARVFLALNTFPREQDFRRWKEAADQGAQAGVGAFIAADIGLLDWMQRDHPDIPRHLSVQASATSATALQWYQQELGIRRAVLPRVLSAQQVTRLAEKSPVELEVFAFGSLCIMAEGRCHLSSWLTGQSPNQQGVCSPASAVRWNETPQNLEARLNGVLIDRYAPHEPAAYPTLCKGRYRSDDRDAYYALEEPASLNTLELLPELMRAGISAVKIEGRQRSPVYVRQVTRVWRAAIDACRDAGGDLVPQQQWRDQLAALSEGVQTTLGAYARTWQ